MNEYVLVTPAKNEAAYIQKVIDSVVSQTVLPTKWIIVSDGSTDETDEIVGHASESYSFIQLLRLSERERRSFGSKAFAFEQGFRKIERIPFWYIGNLDADVSFEPVYYARMILEMDRNPCLGVASGVIWDKARSNFKRTISSLNHAVGAVQFWRRECFEIIGGYKPVTVGGLDSLAELTARMQGWETKSFSDLPVYHHKPLDVVNGRNATRIAYRSGLTEYYIGTSPLFALAKAIRRCGERPLILGSLVRLFAYGRLWLAGVKRDASDELVNFLKKEQLGLLKQAIFHFRICPTSHMKQ